MADGGRQIVKIVKEICEESDVKYQGFSYDWIMRLSKDEKIMYICGYKFPNNNSSAEQICSDKAALSDVLLSAGIPHVEHTFFMSPKHLRGNEKEEQEKQISALLIKYKKLVCKPSFGSGGEDVYKVENAIDLQNAMNMIFDGAKAMCIAPYIEIEAEYRIIILNYNVMAVYEKKRPFVIGNGVHSVKELIDGNKDLIGVETDPKLDFGYIPKKNEITEISWKHNLGKGAKPENMCEGLFKEELSALALSAAKAVGAEFVSADIIKTDEGLLILELNSGIMMENYSQSSAENYARAKDIYKNAIISFLNE